MEKVLVVEVLTEVLEKEGAAKGRLMEDKGLEKQEGALVAAIAFEYSGFLDRSRLSAVKVVVVATSFPWWVGVLGKTGAKVGRICLLFTLSWLALASSYFALFGITVVGIKRLVDMGGLTGVHSMFLDWKWTREDLRWLSQVGPACVVSAKGLSVSLFGYSTAWLPVSHCSLGGVTDFQGRVCVLTRVSSGPLTIQPALLPTGSSRDLRSVLKCGSLGTSKPPPSPMPRVLGDRLIFLRP